MRTYIFAAPVLALVALSSSVAQKLGPEGNQDMIQSVIFRASFEFRNELMYKDQEKWIGQTVSFRGSFSRRPDILNVDEPYTECARTTDLLEPIICIVFFDTALLTSPDSSQTGMAISPDNEYRVFGIIGRCREVISRGGTIKILPTLDLLLVYRADDQTFQEPLWMSKRVQRH